MARIVKPDIRKPASSPTREYEEHIPRVLATEGGHLSIGRGGNPFRAGPRNRFYSYLDSCGRCDRSGREQRLGWDAVISIGASSSRSSPR